MSYSFDVKNQLLSVEAAPCCRKAELYGFLLFSNTVSPDQIRIVTAYPEIRTRYLGFLMEAGVKRFELSCHGQKVKKYICEITAKGALSAVFRWLDGLCFAPPIRLDRRLLEQECCRRAFLRGAFMANAVIVSPDKGCCVEFRTAHQMLAGDFFSFCQEDLDLLPGTSVRNGKRLIYFKSWDAVKDLLLLMGAKDAAYDLANREIEHSFRGTANRRFNCDNANIQRSVDAAGAQIDAIRSLRDRGEVLPDGLEEVARLRLEYPDDTLTALGQRCVPPISKAGVAHRLKKLCGLASQMGE